MNLIELNSSNERLQLLKKIAQPFQERAYEHDLQGSFPKENIADLVNSGYHVLTVPEKYGGKEISLLEMVKAQEIIAEMDGSTALSIGWHVGIIKGIHDSKSWDEPLYERVLRDVVENGALINSASSEKATGSPTRGGKPETKAKLAGKHWVITGRKVFATMAPVLDYFIVTASITDSDKVASFLIHKDMEGVSIEETWDSIAMRATGSHDLVLNEVKVPKEMLIEYIIPGNKRAEGWLLHIPACYLGIAKAAFRYAVNFSLSYSPNSIERTKTISDLPNVRQKIGDMYLKIIQCEHFLYSVARKWDESGYEERQKMKPELSAAKSSITNAALEIVDLAMRLTGLYSLSQKNPLQRYYRDVRAGLHNPPMDDVTNMLLADVAIAKMRQEKNP